MEKKKFFSNCIDAVLAVTLLVLIGVLVWANLFHYTAYMEADIASESLFIEVMHDAGSLFPSSWVSSSGLRIMTPTDLALIFYPLTGYDSNLALGIACSVMMVIVFLFMFLYMREAGFSTRQILLAAILVIAVNRPAQQVQKMLFLYAAYYTDQVISLFITLIVYEKFRKNGRLPVIGAVVTAILAVLNGLQGFHGLMYCYFPVVAVEVLRHLRSIIRKEKLSQIGMTIWVFALAAIAFCTSIFTDVYSPETSRNIRHAPEKFFGEVLPMIGNIFDTRRLLILTIAFALAAVLGYLLIYVKKAEDFRWSSLSFIISVGGYILVTTFTTSIVSERYYMMIIFAIGVGVAFFARFFGGKVEYIVAGLVVIYGLVAAGNYTKALIINDNSQNTEMFRVAEWMKEKGYSYGYATFDHANTITVVAKGDVKVRALNNFADLEGCKWLSDENWYPPVKSSEGATCYIVSPAGKGDFQTYLTENDPKIIETTTIGSYEIYVLDHDYTVWER